MTTQQAVDRGLEIKAQIETLNDELTTIEEHLKKAALKGEQIPLEDADREGMKYEAKGTESIVPVILTADILQATFIDGTPIHARLANIAGDALPQFYRPQTTWKMLAPSGKAFRLEASAILGQKAPDFICAATAKDKHGTPKSQIKVHWDRAEDLT